MPTTHTVAPDESMAVIANRYSFRDWRWIYADAANADFRKLCPDPNLLLPGTELVIPDPDAVGWHARRTGSEHEFLLVRNNDHLRLRLLSRDGEPIAGWAYELEVRGEQHTGTVPDDGVVDIELGGPALTATLRTWPAHGDRPGDEDAIELIIGGLLPAAEPGGQQARLANLGVLEAEPDGDLSGRETQAALRLLGNPTPATLSQKHGC